MDPEPGRATRAHRDPVGSMTQAEALRAVAASHAGRLEGASLTVKAEADLNVRDPSTRRPQPPPRGSRR